VICDEVAAKIILEINKKLHNKFTAQLTELPAIPGWFDKDEVAVP
jgi:hypothetical protein